jgi:antitoxin component YwqK of YwqJK toxin-antitoxin module
MISKPYAALAACLLLGACSSQKIDERQTDDIQGLVYKHGDSDPFTGTVIHSKLKRFQSVIVDDCSVNYKKGVLDGEMDCSDNNGTKVFEANFVDEKKSGVEKRWSASTGELTYQASWDAGNKDGVEKTYDPTGKTLLQQITWSGGAQAGTEKTWDAQGKLMTDLDWKDGKQTGTQRTDTGTQIIEVTYKDGRYDGVKKISDTTGVIEETSFKMGVLSGTQTFYRFGVPEVVRKWIDGKIVSQSITRHIDKNTVYETDDFQCSPACAVDTDQYGDAHSIAMETAMNRQVQFPKIALRPIASVDQADDNLAQDGFAGFKDAAGLAASEITHVANGVDFSPIAKLETTFKGEGVVGVQKGYDANGALIVEAQRSSDGRFSAKGSWWSAAVSGQTGPEAQPSPTAALTDAASGANGGATALNSTTPASAPQPASGNEASPPQPALAQRPTPATATQNSAPSLTSTTYGNVVASYFPGESAEDAVRDGLSKIKSSLSVSGIDYLGYPDYELECGKDGQCFNGTGTPFGDVADNAKEMFPVNPADIQQYALQCHVICHDSQGQIIGSAP